MKLMKLLVGAALVSTSLTTFAVDMRIDTSAFSGTDYDTTFVGIGDVDRVTGTFDEFGFSQMLATSIYDWSDASIFGPFVDTNIPSELIDYGIPAAGISGLSVDGTTTVDLDHPIEDSQTDIDALSPLVPPLSSDNEGYLATWYLDTEFLLGGTLDGTGPSYTSGWMKFYFVDVGAGTRTEVLEMEVTGSNLQAGNLNLFFDVTSVLDGLFLVDTGSGFVDMEDLVTANGFFPMVLDTNVDPAIPTLDQLLEISNLNGPQAARQARLDGSITPNVVPEPSTLAILGVGLLGLGFAGRRKAS